MLEEGRICLHLEAPAAVVMERLGLEAKAVDTDTYQAEFPMGLLTAQDTGIDRQGRMCSSVSLTYDTNRLSETMEAAIRRVVPGGAAAGLIELAGWI